MLTRMRPALWQAVAAELKTTHPDCRLTAVDDFNARIKARDSTARIRAFYQPREGDVAGEARIWLSLDGQTELDAIAHYISEQETYAKRLKYPLHFSQELAQHLPDGLGEATLSFKASVVSWHSADFISRVSGFYADSVRDLIALHADLSLRRE